MDATEGERVVWQGRIKDADITVTNLRLIIQRGGDTRDILLDKIDSVELKRSLSMCYLGAVVGLVFPLTAMIAVPLAGGQVQGAELLLSFATGAALALYGWLNRFRLVINYGWSSIELRSSNAYKIMAQLRDALFKAKKG